MIRYFFIFGSTAQLSQAELLQLFKYLQLTPKNYKLMGERVFLVEFTHKINPVSLMEWLGGTIKIGQIVDKVRHLDSEKLAKIIKTHAASDWGLSYYADPKVDLLQLAQEVKQKLPQHQRFVIPRKGEHEISAVVLAKQKLNEFVLVFDEAKNSWWVGLTETFQNVDEWTKRDLGRTFFDSKRGMLPLKVARMLTNLALPDNPKRRRILLDPFCGMGTILIEGLTTGWQVIGSDISETVIQKAKKNLDQLSLTTQRLHPTNRGYKLMVSDATHISQNLSVSLLDAIVTEPYMGPPFENIKGQLFYRGQPPTQKNIINALRGLEKLYLGCLKDWTKVLKPQAKVIIIFPEIRWQGKNYRVKKPIDNCEKLGYTLVQNPMAYARPQAIVRRLIYIFHKK